jgi:hypothetical protein
MTEEYGFQPKSPTAGAGLSSQAEGSANAAARSGTTGDAPAGRSQQAPSFLTQAIKSTPAPQADPDKLQALRAKVAEARDLEALKKDLEERVKETSAKLNELDHKTLPDAFDELGITSIELLPEGNNPGVIAKAQPYYHASIQSSWPDDKRQDAFDCLKEEGAESLIKMTVVVQFPREQHEDSTFFARTCRDQGMEVIVKEDVAWATLTAWLRGEVEDRNHVPPLERLGATIGRVVKRKLVKAK